MSLGEFREDMGDFRRVQWRCLRDGVDPSGPAAAVWLAEAAAARGRTGSAKSLVLARGMADTILGAGWEERLALQRRLKEWAVILACAALSVWIWM